MMIQFVDDIARINFSEVALLLHDMRWCKGVTEAEARFAAENSAVVLAAYQKAQLIGYLRVVSDRTCFAYVMDVVVAHQERGKGLGSELMSRARQHERLKHVYQWMLRTPDAQAFYTKQGFRSLVHPDQWMLIQENRPTDRLTTKFESK